MRSRDAPRRCGNMRWSFGRTRGDLVDTGGHGRRRREDDQHLDRGGARPRRQRAGVAKHGNRAVSSASGSADVLEALGFNLELAPETDRAFDRRAGLRRPVRADPPPPRCATPHRYGASSPRVPSSTCSARSQTRPGPAPRWSASTRRARPHDRGLARQGLERPVPSSSTVDGGIDELSPSGPNVVARWWTATSGRETSTRSNSGSSAATRPSCAAASPGERGAIHAVFAGENGGRRNAILLNAAGAIAAGGHAEDLREGLELARDAVDFGRCGGAAPAVDAFSVQAAG